MTVWIPRRSVLGCALLAASLVVASGCGTAEYENRLNTQGLAAANLAKVLAAYDKLYGDDKIYAGDANSPTIRVPRLVQLQYAKGAADDQFGNQPIAATEWTVPKMELPAQKVCWRGYSNGSGGLNYPLYVYLGQQKAGTSPPLVDAVNAQLAKGFPGTAATWSDVSVLAADGVSQVPWKKAQIKADMAFGTPPQGETTVPGTLDIYVYNGGGWEVLVAFRIPDDLDRNTELTTVIAPAVLGSIQVPAAAAPAG